MHVQRDRQRAKFWLDPVSLAENDGFRSKELREIERLIVAHVDVLRREWDEHCDGA